MHALSLRSRLNFFYRFVASFLAFLSDRLQVHLVHPEIIVAILRKNVSRRETCPPNAKINYTVAIITYFFLVYRKQGFEGKVQIHISLHLPGGECFFRNCSIRSSQTLNKIDFQYVQLGAGTSFLFSARTTLLEKSLSIALQSRDLSSLLACPSDNILRLKQ